MKYNGNELLMMLITFYVRQEHLLLSLCFHEEDFYLTHPFTSDLLITQALVI